MSDEKERDSEPLPQDLALFAEEAFAIKRLIDNNPRVLTLGEIGAIYGRAYTYSGGSS